MHEPDGQPAATTDSTAGAASSASSASSTPGAEMRQAIAYLRSPAAIRERAGQVLEAGLAGKLAHFAVHPDRLGAVAEYVADVTRRAYPNLDIPYHSRWNHFRAGGIDRLTRLEETLASLPPEERGRCLYDLVITSVLLDAGAGEAWRYVELGTGATFARSEGLAVASFHMFLAGVFSSDPSLPWQVDAEGLRRITPEHLARHFQASPDNPLVGLSGRAELLVRLGDALAAAPHVFDASGNGTSVPLRPGGMFDHLLAQARDDDQLPAAAILRAVVDGLGPIWPGRVTLGSANLGDVWHHPAAGGTGPGAGLVPFHKLSQWLTYSLIEPLEAHGIRVVGMDELTGLPEYRNGGLLVDLGVLEPRHEEVTARAHAPGSEIIVEWRALTVALLDRVAELVRQALGVSREQLPLAKVLEGGTWSAGRQIARERRPDGAPPIRIDSDGTVF